MFICPRYNISVAEASMNIQFNHVDKVVKYNLNNMFYNLQNILWVEKIYSSIYNEFIRKNILAK